MLMKLTHEEENNRTGRGACLDEVVEEKQSVVMHLTPRLMDETAMQRVGQEWPRQGEEPSQQP